MGSEEGQEVVRYPSEVRIRYEVGWVCMAL